MRSQSHTPGVFVIWRFDRDWRILCKMIHSHSWLVATGCQFLSLWVLMQGSLHVFMTEWLVPCRVSQQSKRARRKRQCHVWPHLGSHTLSVLQCSTHHAVLPCWCGRVCAKTPLPEGKGHWAPSWRLGTRVPVFRISFQLHVLFILPLPKSQIESSFHFSCLLPSPRLSILSSAVIAFHLTFRLITLTHSSHSRRSFFQWINSTY